MLLATIVLLGALPQSGQLARSVASVSATAPVGVAAKDPIEARTLPSMPKPKVETDPEPEPEPKPKPKVKPKTEPAPEPEPEPKPKPKTEPKPQSDRKTAAVKDWAGFVLSGLGK